MDGVKMLNEFIAVHRNQLESSGVPQHLWEQLYRKLSTDNFDAGMVFQLMLIEYEDENGLEEEESNSILPPTIYRPVFSLHVAGEHGLKANDPNAIFLVDHAWTFRLDGTTAVRRQLEQNERLADRLCATMGVDIEDENRVDKLLESMWRYIQHYSIAPLHEGAPMPSQMDVESHLPIWYMTDEVGAAIQHSDEPNCRLVPFMYLNNQITYSLLFPIRDCSYDEQMTRNFLENIPQDAPERLALLLPWRKIDLREHSFAQVEPNVEYFTQGHIVESLPRPSEIGGDDPIINTHSGVPLNVFSQYDAVCRYLTTPEFRFVENVDEADILWLTTHFKDFAELQNIAPQRRINQFPFEYVITIKDLLAIICRRTTGATEIGMGDGKNMNESNTAKSLEMLPQWLPATFNLKTELTQFVSYFQQRAIAGLDNHWIIKPWNLARSLDTHITSNLAQIVRLIITGPKIAQKYIERPVLFRRTDLLLPIEGDNPSSPPAVKFDVRYVLLLYSVQPLKAYIHRKFFLRFANQPFEMNGFDDYERHFTVMNYRDNTTMRHLKCDDFLLQWHEQYPEHSWMNVETDICEMLHEMLVCATTKSTPPSAIAPSPQSRALYAADIMLEWYPSNENANANTNLRIQPKLLEVNWTPDCQRACEYYPDFFNDIFKLLFLDVENDDIFRLLTDKTQEVQ